MEILERSLFRVTRDGDLEVADEADDLLEAVEFQLRRARFGEVTRLEVSESMSQAMLRAAAAGPARAGRARLSAGRDARPRRSRRALPARPARPQERSVGAGRRGRRGTPSSRPPSSSPRSAPATSSSTIPYDSFASSFESYVDRAAADPRGDRDQVDRVPDERRHAARTRADRRVGARQADRVSRRDQGARRRAPQHRVVALARAGGRPHRLRLPGPQDPREDDARRAPRGGRAAPLRPPRHRQLQRRHRAQLRGLRALHRRRGHRRRRRRPLQPPDRIRAAGRTSASCWWRRSRCASG